MIVAAIVALFMTVPGVLFPVQISAVFGLDTATTELAADFIFWMSWFNLAFAVNMIVGSALRAAGDVMTPLWLGVATNLVYLLTVYVFVYGAWGIPALGVKGAAIANGIAFSFAGLLLMWLWWRGKLVLGWRRIVFWEGERVRQLLHIGYPAGLEQLIFRIGFFLFLGIIGHYYGTAAYAAYGIGINVLSLCFVVGFGFSISGSTLVGQYLGARDTAGAIPSGWRSLWLVLGSMAAIGAVCTIFAEQIARFMIEDEEVVDLTISFIYIMGSVMPLMAVEFAIGGALRGAGDTRAPLRATLVGLLVMRCGLAIIFTFYEFSVVWIYGAIVGDYLAKAVMLLHRFYHGRWQTVIPNTPQPAAKTARVALPQWRGAVGPGAGWRLLSAAHVR